MNSSKENIFSVSKDGEKQERHQEKIPDEDSLATFKNQPALTKVQLEKSENRYGAGSRYFVLPAGGMHVAVPELQFHVDHFLNREGGDFTSSKSEVESFASVKKESQKGSKLPFGLELTAGPSLRKSGEGKMSKRAPPPSQTLFDSAALLKSYFSFSQDKDSADNSSNEYEETVKNKVMGLWHTMKYGWSANLETKFSRNTPIYLLGRVYHKTFKEEQLGDGTGFVCSNIEGFKKDFASLGWFTYRRKFPPLPESCLTSDCGWGCMIRSGQMMMMTALRRHFLPAGWRYENNDDDPQASVHKRLMRMFCDDPSPLCPFSLHNLILSGHKMNKKAGNWYGPSCVAHMFKGTIEEGSSHIPALNKIRVYVAQDGAVYVQDILDMCSGDECVCRKSFARTSSRTDNQFNARASDYSLCSAAKEHLSDYCKRECLPSRLNSDKLLSDCDNNSDWLLIGPDEHFVEVCSPAYIDKGVVPLDLFVDVNRELAKGLRRPFGDAMVNRVSEVHFNGPVGDGMNGSGVRYEEKTPCNRCHGWKSCIIFIPVRLGGATVNPIYNNCIYSLFLHDLCIGIIGGRPKHSLYFVGFQDDSLIHLDPHLSQDAVPLDGNFPLSSYHCCSPRKVNIAKMDPSATIGFYCHTRSHFFRLLEEAPMFATAKDGNLDSPIFEFVDGRSEDVNGWMEQTLSDEAARMSFSSSPPLAKETSDTPTYDESEELVFE